MNDQPQDARTAAEHPSPTSASSDRVLGSWEIVYRRYDPQAQPLREALTTLGNGHFASRGAAEEAVAGGPHYPGTYVAGGYDRLPSHIEGRVVENEDLVNWPSWLWLRFRCDDGPWFDLDRMIIREYELRLHLYRGVRTRHMHLRDPSDRELLLDVRRLVHMGDANLAAMRWTLTPLGWSGRVEIESGIDGRVTNSGVERYRQLEGRHLEILGRGGTGEDAVFMVSRARQSKLVVAQAVRTRVELDDAARAIERRTRSAPRWVGQSLSFDVEANRAVTVEKIASLFTSRDFAISEPCHEACERVHRAPGFSALLDTHERAWERLWRRADLILESEDAGYAQSILRLHVFHLLQTASLNTIGRDVGIPARGWHGEAYRGHIFWDELFAFPFLNFRLPELTRSLLLYRHRRLERARQAARDEGYEGAMYPWQSGSDGREESQVVHLNPRSGRWLPDETHKQRHVGAAIAYNVWQYFQATRDAEFLSSYGAEMMLEIARFWASIAEYDPHLERYRIRGVVGPDEFHTRYPDREEGGLDDNAYTNVMAAWVLRTAGTLAEVLPEDRWDELSNELDLTAEELDDWDTISRRLHVPIDDGGIIQQFEGWQRLAELDWEGLEERHGSVERLDRLLEAENDDPNRYKASKQADVLMLFYLFSAEELTELFERLGYRFDPDRIPDNVRYYLARTSHGSTLSQVVHAWVLARTDRVRSWHLFHEALRSDIDDVQGGTTPEGIHVGAMAGTVDLVQRGYTGMEMRDGVLWFNPQLPAELECLALAIRYRCHWLRLHVTQDTLAIRCDKGPPGPIRVGLGGRIHEIDQGDRLELDLARPS